MQSDYFAFIAAAYAVSFLALVGLGLWVLVDARARRAELKALEVKGIRRRSEQMERDLDALEDAAHLALARRQSEQHGSKA